MHRQAFGRVAGGAEQENTRVAGVGIKFADYAELVAAAFEAGQALFCRPPSGGWPAKERRFFWAFTRGSLAMCGGARQPRANVRCPFRASQFARGARRAVGGGQMRREFF